MTTGKRIDRAGQGRRLALKVMAMLVALGAGAALAWFWRPLNAHAVTSAAHAARIACSCRYAAARPLSQCREFDRGTALLRLSEDEEEKRVTARFFLLARQSARWREGSGCVLESWEGQLAPSVLSIQPPPTTRSPA